MMYSLPPESPAARQNRARYRKQALERVAVALATAEEAPGDVWLMTWFEYEDGDAEGVFDTLASASAYLNSRFPKADSQPDWDDVVDGAFETNRDSRTYRLRKTMIHRSP